MKLKCLLDSASSSSFTPSASMCLISRCHGRLWNHGYARISFARRRSSSVSGIVTCATCHPADLTPDLRDLAEAAARTLEMAYAGVDILRDTAGRAWVIEVNGVPAWTGLQQVCGFDLAAALVADLLHRHRGAPRMEAVG